MKTLAAGFPSASRTQASPVTVVDDIVLWWWISVSPDERSILYVRLAEAESDIMLVENFR